MANLTNLTQDQPIFRHETAQPIKILSTDYANENIQKRLVKENSIVYIAGYLLRKTYNVHKCQQCSNLVSDDDISDDQSALLVFKAYETDTSSFGGLIAPSTSMLLYTTALEDEFVQYFKQLRKTTDIGKDLLKRLMEIRLDVSCPNFDKNFLLRLFVRMRIYYCLKFENRNLSKTKKRKNRKYLKVAHL